jgi:hypothetical protein
MDSRRSTVRGRAQHATIGAAALFVVAIIVGTAAMTGSLPIGLSLSMTYLLFCGVALGCLWLWRTATGAIFNPYGLWLLAVLAFNGGQIPLELLAMNPRGPLDLMAPPQVLIETVVLVTWCVAAMQVGALLALSRGPRRAARLDQHPMWIPGATVIGYFLLAVSLVPFYLTARDAVSLVSDFGYTQLYRITPLTSYAATPRILAEFIVPAAMFMLVGAAGRWSRIAPSLGVILMYAAVHLFLGDRANATLPLIAWLWLFHTTVRQIPTRLLITGSAIMVVAFAAIGVLRDLDSVNRASLGIIGALASSANPFTGILAEVGGSMSTVAYTIELIPSIRPFDLGQGYGLALLTVIPNLSGGIHPALAHGDYETWVTAAMFPIYAATGHGLGYSVIAEAYANFGWFALIPCAAIGFGVGSLQFWSSSPGRYLPIRAAAVASYLPFLLFFARSESNAIVRPLFWYAMIPAAAVYASDRFILKRRRSRGRLPSMATP